MNRTIFVLTIILMWLTLSQEMISQQILTTGGSDIAIDPLGQTVFIAGRDLLVRSTDGGNTWSATETPYVNPERVIVKFDNPQEVIVAKEGEIAFSTTAGAGPWNVAFQDSSLSPLRFVQSLVNPNILFLTRALVDTCFTLLQSNDGGDTWFPQTYFTPRKSLYDIAVYPDSTDLGWRDLAFLCGRSGIGPHNDDGYWQGGYWLGTYYWIAASMVWPPVLLDYTSIAIIPRPYPDFYPIRFVSVDAPDGRDTIFSNDNFSSAERIPVFWDADSIRMIRIRKSTNQIFVATERGIFFSADSGATWEQRNIGLIDTNIVAIALPDQGGKVFAVTGSSSFISTNDGDSWQTIVTDVQPPSLEMATTFWLSDNYPNPFNPSTRIEYRIPAKEFVQLRVFDVLGKEISTLVNQVQSHGTHVAEFAGDGLPSGVYFYRLEAGTFVEQRKMVLLR